MNILMNKLGKQNLARFIRAFLGLFLVFIVLIIAIYFFIHWRREPRVRADQKEEIAKQKVDVKEQIQYLEFKGGQGKTQIRADKNYVGEDNYYHLEGNVRIIDYGKHGEQKISITGDRVIYDREQNQFSLQGRVRVEYKDFVYKSDILEYDKKKELMTCETGVNFTSDRFIGYAKKMSYSVGRDILFLEDDLWISMKPKIENVEPLLVKGKKATYNLRVGKGTVEGELKLSRGQSYGTADQIEYEQCFPETSDLKVLYIKGQVKLFLKSEKEKAAKEKKSYPKDLSGFHVLESETQEIKAEEIKVRTFLFSPIIHAIESQGNCFFKFNSSSGSFTSIQGQTVDFIFSKEGVLREFRAFNGAKIINSENKAGENLVIEGESMKLDGWTKNLSVQGNTDRPARFISEGSEFLAEKIDINLQDGNLKAEGRVKVVLNKRERTEESLGFFSKERPVFITAQQMRYLKDQKRFIFREHIKIWQEKEMLEAQDVSFFEETGEMLAEGGVKSVFPHKLKEEEKEERVEVTGRKMSFDSQKNCISYEEDCSLKTKNISLSCQSISIYLSEDRTKTKAILARKRVTIIQETKEAKAEEANYNLDEETIVLTGNPQYKDRERGMVEGGKLTFHLGDGRIVVENRDRERSVTIIKS